MKATITTASSRPLSKTLSLAHSVRMTRKPTGSSFFGMKPLFGKLQNPPHFRLLVKWLQPVIKMFFIRFMLKKVATCAIQLSMEIIGARIGLSGFPQQEKWPWLQQQTNLPWPM